MPQEQLWVPPDKENWGWREQDTRKKKNSSGAVLCSAPAPPAPAWLGKTQESGGIRARIQPGVPVDEGAAASGGLGDLRDLGRCSWLSCCILGISGEWDVVAGRDLGLLPLAPSSIPAAISLFPQALGQDQEL